MEEVTITDADNRGRVTARVGDVISVRLHDNPTTGYQWRISFVDDKVLTAQGNAFTSEHHGLGSGGDAIWTFLVRERGDTRLEFVRSRAWERESPLEQFVVHLAITT